MEFTVAQIAGILGGEIEGNPDAVVNTLSKIEEGQEKSLTFLANPEINITQDSRSRSELELFPVLPVDSNRNQHFSLSSRVSKKTFEKIDCENLRIFLYVGENYHENFRF